MKVHDMLTLKEDNPIKLFGEWVTETQLNDPDKPLAATLATVDSLGRPSARMVLLKGHDSGEFTFYTNLNSRKGRDLVVNPNAALCFYWEILGRQVRVEGQVSIVNSSEANLYFRSRPRDSQISAWASRQSDVLDDFKTLEKNVEIYNKKFSNGEVSRPKFWSGVKLVPRNIEFWQQRPSRLHQRLLFEATENGWNRKWLFP